LPAVIIIRRERRKVVSLGFLAVREVSSSSENQTNSKKKTENITECISPQISPLCTLNTLRKGGDTSKDLTMTFIPL